jgi:tetraacyldisaccharide 4'-kinase
MAGIERHWQRLTLFAFLLLPLSALFCGLVALRRALYRRRILPSQRLPVPVIVVGNITVGGTGKTPLVMWLARMLKDEGYRPGIVARGYRGRAQRWPLTVGPETSPVEAGDEAVLLARRGGCPVVAGPDRVADARRLVELGCNVIVSDDGLQHYRLQRDIEIAVIDGVRRFGNGLCLPAGPLREPVSRLREVDWRVTNGEPREGEIGMRLAHTEIYRLDAPGQHAEMSEFDFGLVHAVAGIGNPGRFFDSLRALGLDIRPHPFPDHHLFRAADLEFGDHHPVLMTEKDAVKCRQFAQSHHWVVAITAQPEPRLAEVIRERLKEIQRG